MIIVCCGLRRSASTLQYHIVQDIAELYGGVDGGWIIHRKSFPNDIQKHAPGQLVTYKVHAYIVPSIFTSGRAKAIYIFRDPRDIYASLKRFRPKGSDIESLKAINNEHTFWYNLPGTYISRYDDVVNNIYGEAKNIASHLDLDITDSQAEKIADKRSIENQRKLQPDKGWDSKSTLWHNHIYTGDSGVWKEELSSPELSMVTLHMPNIMRDYYNEK
jgi:hypothetical protein